MNNTIVINMAEMVVGKGKLIFRTGSIGSCIVIVIYDKTRRIGGMVHSMLPIKTSIIDEKKSSQKAKYVDLAIKTLSDELKKLGADQGQLEARLVGGAKMFASFDRDNRSIGEENIKSARRELVKLGIRIRSEDVGGTVGRIVKFDLSTGIVEVETKM